MNFLLSLIEKMVKHSGHARELVLVLAKHLTAEHLHEAISVFQTYLTVLDPAIAPEAAAVEVVIEQVVVKVEAAAASVPEDTAAPVAADPTPAATVDQAVVAAVDMPVVATADPVVAPAPAGKAWKAPAKKAA